LQAIVISLALYAAYLRSLGETSCLNGHIVATVSQEKNVCYF